MSSPEGIEGVYINSERQLVEAPDGHHGNKLEESGLVDIHGYLVLHPAAAQRAGLHLLVDGILPEVSLTLTLLPTRLLLQDDRTFKVSVTVLRANLTGVKMES